MQSFFKGNWIGGASKNISIDKLSQLNKTDDAVSALQQAIQSKNNAYMRGAADLITRMCEQDRTKAVSTELGSLGACSLVDQMLSLRTDITADSNLICEACLRAACSLVVAPASSEWLSGVGTGGVVTGASYSSAECIAGVVNNRKNFSSHGPIYRIIKVTTNHLHDEIVLEWGLRVLYHLSLEKGMLRCVSFDCIASVDCILSILIIVITSLQVWCLAFSPVECAPWCRRL